MMEKAIRTISVTPDSELALLIKEAITAGGRVVVDTGEESYRVDISPAAHRPAGTHLRQVAHRLAGSLADVDVPGWESSEAAERWVAKLREADAYPLEPKSQP
jgi:hypothetical protein